MSVIVIGLGLGALFAQAPGPLLWDEVQAEAGNEDYAGRSEQVEAKAAAGHFIASSWRAHSSWVHALAPHNPAAVSSILS